MARLQMIQLVTSSCHLLLCVHCPVETGHDHTFDISREVAMFQRTPRSNSTYPILP